MCRGLGLVADLDDPTMIHDCPNCAFAREHGTAFEVIKRDVAPAVGFSERVASPAVRAQANYELWQFDPGAGLARTLLVSWDVGEVYRAKWDAEEQIHSGVSQ